jgi:hypothetical protein
MKLLTTVLIAAALTVSAGLAGVTDQMAEERYRAKYGRYTPAEEKRPQSSLEARKNTPVSCDRDACCHAAPAKAALTGKVVKTTTASDVAERFRAKWGRNPSGMEPSRAAADPAVSAATEASYSAQNTSVYINDAAARFQAKTGRTTQINTAPTQVETRGAELLAQASFACEHECCTQEK